MSMVAPLERDEVRDRGWYDFVLEIGVRTICECRVQCSY